MNALSGTGKLMMTVEAAFAKESLRSMSNDDMRNIRKEFQEETHRSISVASLAMPRMNMAAGNQPEQAALACCISVLPLPWKVVTRNHY